jgi:hypothetical protein
LTRNCAGQILALIVLPLVNFDRIYLTAWGLRTLGLSGKGGGGFQRKFVPVRYARPSFNERMLTVW